MTRKRRKKALYEVIGKGRAKSRIGNSLDQQYSSKSVESGSMAESSNAELSVAARWPTKPRIVQFNAGRIELSMPYQLGIALLLGLILLVLVAFRLGQQNSPAATSSPAKTSKIAQETVTREVGKAEKVIKPEVIEKTKRTAKNEKTAIPKGDHRIVIVQFHKKRDLIPVQRHFAEYGIETIIEQEGRTFFLRTKDAYGNPQRAGTDGYAAKQKIIDVGAKYKALRNYESFAPKLFSDAYGEKIK